MKIKFITREERSALMTQAMGKQRNDIGWVDLMGRRLMVIANDTLCLIKGEDTLLNTPDELAEIGPSFTPAEAGKLIAIIKEGTRHPC